MQVAAARRGKEASCTTRFGSVTCHRHVTRDGARSGRSSRPRGRPAATLHITVRAMFRRVDPDAGLKHARRNGITQPDDATLEPVASSAALAKGLTLAPSE